MSLIFNNDMVVNNNVSVRTYNICTYMKTFLKSLKLISIIFDSAHSLC